MILVSLFGGPGAGKSTGAAHIFSQLKQLDSREIEYYETTGDAAGYDAILENILEKLT